jgi:hypothetical protein
MHAKLCAFSTHFSLKNILRSIMLCACLFLLWYCVMLLINWYDPGFHLVATFSSAIMVSTGRSWGIVEKVIS